MKFNKKFIDSCKTLISLEVGDNDEQMDIYINECKTKISGAKDPKEKSEILHSMEKTIAGLQDNINQEVSTLVNKFKNSWSPFGTDKKALLIESTFAKIPITERSQLAQTDSTNIQDLQKSIASHRHFFRSENFHLNEKGDVNLNSSASSFKNMKNKFKSQLENSIKKEIEDDADSNTHINKPTP